MIGVFNTNTQEIKMFETVEQFFNYITTIENEKMLPGHKDFGKTQWSFQIMSVHYVRELYTHTKEDKRTQALCEAYEQELPLLEICHGDFTNPARFPLTPDTDLEDLKMDWCRAYCKVHQFYLIEKE